MELAEKNSEIVRMYAPSIFLFYTSVKTVLRWVSSAPFTYLCSVMVLHNTLVSMYIDIFTCVVLDRTCFCYLAL